MAYSIDCWWVFQNCVFCQGWWSDVHSGRFFIEAGGATYPAEVIPMSRPDVAAHYGLGAEFWGFRLRVALNPQLSDEELRNASLTLRSENEAIAIPHPAEASRQIAARDLARAEAHFWESVHNRTEPTVLEIGSRARSGIVRRQMFRTDRYIGLDIVKGENVDVVGDAHFLSRYFSAESFDFVYSISTFEHLIMPWKVAIEMNSVMRTGGLALVQSHQAWPAHDEPWDYWRFSKWGWHGIFNRATGFEVVESVNADPATLLSAVQTGNAAVMTNNETCYQTTVVVARKVADTTLQWDCDPREIAVSLYPA